MRIASCDAPISIENTATGNLSSSATCSPMLIASELLPIDGRPATMTRSPGCKPDVIRSRSVYPVSTGGVVGPGGDFPRRRRELTQDRTLADDFRVVANVRRRGHVAHECAE